jgi:hypothetical protein
MSSESWLAASRREQNGYQVVECCDCSVVSVLLGCTASCAAVCKRQTTSRHGRLGRAVCRAVDAEIGRRLGDRYSRKVRVGAVAFWYMALTAGAKRLHV